MIHFHKQLVGLDEIALVHIDLGDVAVYPREDVDLLVGLNVGCVHEAHVEILADRNDRADADHALLPRVFLGPAADKTESHERDQRQDEDAHEREEWTALEAAHLRRPSRKTST